MSRPHASGRGAHESTDAMFYFVLLMIGLTNLALGYAVAAHFGFGPKNDAELDAARAGAQAYQPSITISGGDNETPIDDLPPAQVIARRSEEVADESADEEPAGDNIPSEVAAFAALSEATHDEESEPNE